MCFRLQLLFKNRRKNVQAAAEENVGQVELFLNSVPLLSSLTYEQKMELVHAFSEEHYAGECCACCSQVLGLWSG